MAAQVATAAAKTDAKVATHSSSQAIALAVTQILSGQDPDDYCTKYQPLYRVKPDCVVEFPDRKNYNEFPVVCPVHGILCKPGEGAFKKGKPKECAYGCPKHCPPKGTGLPSFYAFGVPKAKDSIQEYLDYVWKYGLAFPPPPKPISGGASDKLANQLLPLRGNSLACRPRSPCVVGSHSVRARRPEECDRPETPIENVSLTHVYHYVKDLGVENEEWKLFYSQLCRVKPEGFVQRPIAQDVYVCRKPKHKQELLVKLLPNNKCFIYNINYNDFFGQPDVHYADQVMEFNHNYLEDAPQPYTSSHADSMDKFILRLRPCPYLRWLTLRVYECAIINEFTLPRKTMNNMRSHRDLGFTIHKGRITAVDHDSPAKIAGFEPDYHIIEVDRQNVVRCPDSQIIRLMRTALNTNRQRRCEVVVLHERIYQTLEEPKVGKLHRIICNKGFHLDRWVRLSPYGLE
ncbi:unnamed protein product [Dibothriocephalus latus]|uniref:PDZ domain-containing protein n=1 Tax=Dibothriocephalus latus TaxID=60516 RepID=A0A3P6QKK1_DIBLA|nr:unnamed protein product [Dibothriocephalus latus]